MSDTRQKKGRSFRLATPLRLVTRTQACSPTLSASPYARLRQLGRPLTSQLPSVHAGFFSSRPLACYTDHAASAFSCTAPSVARQSSAAEFGSSAGQRIWAAEESRMLAKTLSQGAWSWSRTPNKRSGEACACIADVEHRIALPAALTCIKKLRSGYVCTTVCPCLFICSSRFLTFLPLQKQQNG